MQTIYLIITVLVLAIIGAAHFHYREKVGLGPEEVRVCASVNQDDCHHVNRTIVGAVYEKALAIAEADEAETFPVEASDIEHTDLIAESELVAIGAEVMEQLSINPTRIAGNDYFDGTKSVNELILFLNFQQKNQQ